MKFIAIIPSRYGSERLPAKPLLKLGGESMIERVYKRVASSVDPTYVATDHPKIAAEVERFGGRVVMTSTNHTNGTSRIAEALSKIEEVEGVEYRHILNIQGDQPFIEPIQIEELKLALSNPKAQIATLMKRIV